MAEKMLHTTLVQSSAKRLRMLEEQGSGTRSRGRRRRGKRREREVGQWSRGVESRSSGEERRRLTLTCTAVTSLAGPRESSDFSCEEASRGPSCSIPSQRTTLSTLLALTQHPAARSLPSSSPGGPRRVSRGGPVNIVELLCACLHVEGLEDLLVGRVKQLAVHLMPGVLRVGPWPRPPPLGLRYASQTSRHDDGRPADLHGVCSGASAIPGMIILVGAGVVPLGGVVVLTAMLPSVSSLFPAMLPAAPSHPPPVLVVVVDAPLVVQHLLHHQPLTVLAQNIQAAWQKSNQDKDCIASR
eukprot:768488-Hanusia_phi.AAC.5